MHVLYKRVVKYAVLTEKYQYAKNGCKTETEKQTMASNFRPANVLHLQSGHKEIRNSCNLKSCLSLQDAKDLQPLQLICYQLTLVLFKCISFFAQDTPFDNIWRYWFSFKGTVKYVHAQGLRGDHYF